MNKILPLWLVFFAFVCCSNQEEVQNKFYKYDVDGLILVDLSGYYYSRNSVQLGKLSFPLDVKKQEVVESLVNANYTLPDLCFDVKALLIILIYPKDDIYEIRQPHSYGSEIDSSISIAITKTEALLPTLFHNNDSVLIAPLMLKSNSFR